MSKKIIKRMPDEMKKALLPERKKLSTLKIVRECREEKRDANEASEKQKRG